MSDDNKEPVESTDLITVASGEDVNESSLPIVSPGDNPPDDASMWIDERTGWVFRKTGKGKVIKCAATKQQQMEDMLRMRLIRANPKLTRKDIKKRTGWPLHYIDSLSSKLKAWEEINISNASTEAVLARALTVIESSMAGIHSTLEEPGVSAGVKVKAYKQLADLAEKMVKLLQDAGMIYKAPTKHDLRAHIHGAILHTDDPVEVAEIGRQAAAFNREFIAEDGAWVPPLKDVVIIDQDE